MFHPRRTIAVFVAAAALVLSAAMAQGLEQTLTVQMGEMYFQVEGSAPNAAIELETGVPYTITFENVGAVTHKVQFGRGVLVEEGVPFAYGEDLFDGVRVRVVGTSGEQQFAIESNYLFELDVDPGATVEMSFTLPNSAQGAWEIGCFVPSTATAPNHYVAGMRAPLLVND